MLRASSRRPVAAAPLTRLFSICMVCVAGMAGSVHADETGNQSSNSLSTPPLTLGTSLSCVAANVSPKQATLDIELHDVNGTVVAADRCTLPPGAVNFGGSQCTVLQAAPAGFVGYCTFAVIQGQKKNIRAAILSHNVNLGLGNVPAALAAE